MRSTTRRGCASSNWSGPSPQPSRAPGRKFSISTSHSAASLRTISYASGCFRSSASERLLRDCTCHHTVVPSLIRRQCRSGSPPAGGSTLITSAPKSASVFAANGPAISCPSSSTFRPSSGPAIRSGPLLRGRGLPCRRLAIVRRESLVECVQRILLRQQLVQVVHDLGLDAVLEGPEQQAQARLELEVVLRHLQFAARAGASERDAVGRPALFVHAFHAEALFRLLGPAERELARGGEAQRVLARDLDVRHRRSPSVSGDAAASAARRASSPHHRTCGNRGPPARTAPRSPAPVRRRPPARRRRRCSPRSPSGRTGGSAPGHRARWPSSSRTPRGIRDTPAP